MTNDVKQPLSFVVIQLTAGLINLVILSALSVLVVNGS
jgi:hypothetical protein